MAEWLERLTSNQKDPRFDSPAGLRGVFSSDQAVSSPIFVEEN